MKTINHANKLIDHAKLHVWRQSLGNNASLGSLREYITCQWFGDLIIDVQFELLKEL